MTWNVLAHSRNRAAVPVLADALRSASTQIRTGAIRAAIKQSDSACHEQLIRRFADLSDVEQAALCEAFRETPLRMSAALSAAVADGNTSTCINACRMLVLCRDYEQFPILIRAAENPHHRHTEQIKAAILQLANRLHQDFATHVTPAHRRCRDPFFVRRPVLRALERSLSNYGRHHQLEIVEAFLLLAPADHPTLVKILHNVHHSCHHQVMSSLSTSKLQAMMQQLVALLHESDTPTCALKLIARRTDRRFLETLLSGLKRPVPIDVLRNMGRLRSIAWLEEQREVLLELDGRAQETAVALATASDISPHAVFELLAMLIRQGLAEGRRASCRALSEFGGRKADALVLTALKDPDSGVQAAAVRQLRQRNLAESLTTLVGKLESTSAEVRDAARSSLAEFNFVRYRATFDQLDNKTARTTGVLVHKVDPSAIFRLAEELTAPSAAVRRRGIAMALAMNAQGAVHEHLIPLTEDEDVSVRVAAVSALAQCQGTEVVSALRLALQDALPEVRETAASGLAKLARNKAAVQDRCGSVRTPLPEARS
jgi:HEAT repeat protein